MNASSERHEMAGAIPLVGSRNRATVCAFDGASVVLRPGTALEETVAIQPSVEDGGSYPSCATFDLLDERGQTIDLDVRLSGHQCSMDPARIATVMVGTTTPVRMVNPDGGAGCAAQVQVRDRVATLSPSSAAPPLPPSQQHGGAPSSKPKASPPSSPRYHVANNTNGQMSTAMLTFAEAPKSAGENQPQKRGCGCRKMKAVLGAPIW